MAVGIIPFVGAKGAYRLKAPFDALVTSGTVYECVAIRRIADVVSNGVDAYQKYFSPNNLTETEYQTAITDGVCIISLVGDNGSSIYVPSTYISSYPGMTGVKYSVVVLGVMLGSIPDTLNLDSLKTKLYEMVQGEVGISSTVEEVVVSEVDILTKEDSDRLEAARIAAITNTASNYTQIKQLQAQNTELLLKNQQLTQYVITHQS